jgi:hypothetical protein
MQSLHRAVQAGTISARRAAREQIREARSRAQELRKRARAHRQQQEHRRHHAIGERQPSPFLGFLVAVFLFIVGLTGYGLYSAGTGSRSALHVADPGGALAEEPRLPITIALVDGDLDEPAVRQHVQQVMESYMHDGYQVVLPDEELVYRNLATLLQSWTGEDCPVDEALEDVLEAQDLYGVVRVNVVADPSDHRPRVYHQLLRSTRAGASERRARAVQVAVAASDRPFLILNDHPARGNPLVDLRVGQIVEAYRGRAWSIVVDEDLETKVRQVMPPGSFDPATEMPARLRRVLEEHGLGGILRIESLPGEGAPHDRVTVRQIDIEAEAPR